MNKTEVSQILRDDLLTGKSKYVHDSYITFDSIQIERENNKFVITFSYKNDILVTMECESPSSEDSIIFHLSDGLMRMEIA